MNMLKIIFISPRVILLFLMLLGSSSSVVSANEIYQNFSGKEVQQEIISPSLGEQINNLFDSVLPYQKNLLFVKANLSSPGDLDTLIENHTIASLNYIKHSRYILPSLGIKELIFPFHIFL